MIGDSLYHDVAGAERLGMNAVHFTAIANSWRPRAQRYRLAMDGIPPDLSFARFWARTA